MGLEVTRWLDHPKRTPRHLHFTPTSSSWLNLVERWFKEITDRRLRRGAFSSVTALIDAIELWTEHWNDDPKPFVWHQPAEEIIAKVRRGRTTLHQMKSARALAESAGKWVAVDRATNEPRLIADSPYELAAEIRRRRLRNVAVVRAPDPSEPELVGLG